MRRCANVENGQQEKQENRRLWARVKGRHTYRHILLRPHLPSIYITDNNNNSSSSLQRPTFQVNKLGPPSHTLRFRCRVSPLYLVTYFLVAPFICPVWVYLYDKLSKESRSEECPPQYIQQPNRLKRSRNQSGLHLLLPNLEATNRPLSYTTP